MSELNLEALESQLRLQAESLREDIVADARVARDEVRMPHWAAAILVEGLRLLDFAQEAWDALVGEVYACGNLVRTEWEQRPSVNAASIERRTRSRKACAADPQPEPTDRWTYDPETLREAIASRVEESY